MDSASRCNFPEPTSVRRRLRAHAWNSGTEGSRPTPPATSSWGWRRLWAARWGAPPTSLERAHARSQHSLFLHFCVVRLDPPHVAVTREVPARIGVPAGVLEGDGRVHVSAEAVSTPSDLFDRQPTPLDLVLQAPSRRLPGRTAQFLVVLEPFLSRPVGKAEAARGVGTSRRTNVVPGPGVSRGDARPRRSDDQHGKSFGLWLEWGRNDCAFGTSQRARRGRVGDR